ncbi:MAG: integrase core domain-containing protein, partial [Chloroflexota bacterium]|nr:integrase core domain-containing protein [Chloroflexota bacterium]
PGLGRRQFTAIDVVSRVALLSARGCAITGTARDHLADLIARMPFPIRAIQVDGGSEFMGEFELARRDAGIPLYVPPPHSPKLNGFVARLNRTVREEIWDRHHGPLDLATLQPALRAWEIACNTDRPHSALGYATPMDYLHSPDFSDVSN